MKQVSHASQIVPLLEKDDATACALLKAQLTHSDGIRGFFVSYLTNEGVADNDEVPKSLVEAIKDISDQSDLIKLSIMNVIMPTAMTSMHTDPDLQKNSSMTAERGIKILNILKDHPDTPMHCKAIYDVATTSIENGDAKQDDSLVMYWIEFFKSWGYEQKQREDIARVIKRFL